MLPDIRSPADLKKLDKKDLILLAKEIRKKIIEVVGKNGGHLASNLGVVELTIALHRVFDSPADAFVWDVSHQCYAHKLLTGRYDSFDTLRKKDGVSGFTKRAESEHDFFDAGHSSTSVSSALGLLTGRALRHQDGKVIAVIGDGALTGGMAMEALSHAGQISKNLIVILNDNQMSISRNTGSLSRYLSRLTMTASYQTFRFNIDRFVGKLPFINTYFTKFIFRFKRSLKALLYQNNLFVELGFEYVGPLNGHNTEELERVFSHVKKLNRPVVVHVVTKKGRGYSPAENDPAAFHGIGPFCISDGTVEKFDTLSFTEAFSAALLDIAAKDSRVVAITAAMAKGTGLGPFARHYPDRFFDVGIAEQHAVTFAGGLSAAGIVPVTAIYSTFMQRAIDQLIHDIALPAAPSVFVLDRAGAVPDDGETHQGAFDIALIRPVPNMIMLAPASAAELGLCLGWAVGRSAPVVIRYPKSTCPSEQVCFSQPLREGRGVLLPYEEFAPVAVSGKARVLLVCTGGIFAEVLAAARSLSLQNIAADIYNIRFIKPVDTAYFVDTAEPYGTVVFVEDGVVTGGIGRQLELSLSEAGLQKKTAVLGLPDAFLAQGKRAEILADAGLSPEHIAAIARSIL
nr:1-deoxy-D-xylulose-5-phosphate synthase [Treponema brennaborense]